MIQLYEISTTHRHKHSSAYQFKDKNNSPFSIMKNVLSLLALALPFTQARWLDCDNSYNPNGCGGGPGSAITCKAPVHTISFNNGNYECHTDGQVAGACSDLTANNDFWHAVGGTSWKDIGLICTNINNYPGQMKRARLESINGNWLWITIEDSLGTGSFGCQVTPCTGIFCNYHCSVN